MSSSMEQKSWPDHWAAVTERSCKLRLWLKRYGLKSFQGIGSRDKPSPQRYGGKGLWGHPVQRASSIFSYSLSLRPKLTAPFNLAPCCSLQETRGNRNPLLKLNEWIFSLVYLRKKFPTHFGGKPKWHTVSTDPEGEISTQIALSNRHKLPDLTLELP